jgi:preprotein translocase subunit SecA
MAGRGTDIQLGGNADMRVNQELGEDPDPARAEAIRAEVARDHDVVIDAGGLYVVGTERHESRRIDNQLRGRSGRQGDPGRSKFFLALDDDLMRIFGSDRMDGLLQRLGLQPGEAIVHPWINKALEKAQKKVEARNFEVRKNLLKFDDVMNDQRKVVYEQRREILDADDVQEMVRDMRHQVIEDLVHRCIPPKAFAEEWDVDTLEDETKRVLGLDAPVRDWAAEEGIAEAEIRERLTDASDRYMAQRAVEVGPDTMRSAEKSLLLQILDHLWKEHLLQLDHLRQGIHLRGFGQRDPLNEYKREAFGLFESMLSNLRQTVTQVLAHMEIREPAAPQPATAPQAMAETREPAMAMAGGDGAAASAVDAERPESWGKVPRNAPCPCGSGKKYKQCHGKLA